MFQIFYTGSALEDISSFRKHEQTTIFDRVDEQLIHQPDLVTRNRKRLRPNGTAEWELRIDDFRVLWENLSKPGVAQATLQRRLGVTAGSVMPPAKLSERHRLRRKQH